MIVGSVHAGFSTALVNGANSVDLPQANLTIVAISILNGAVISIPIDSSRNAFFMNGGYLSEHPVKNHVHFQVNGQTLNFNSYGTSGQVIFYYGYVYGDSRPLTAYAGVLATASLSAASTGSLSFSFPSGELNLTAMKFKVSATYTWMEAQFNTSSGQSLTMGQDAYIATNLDGDLFQLWLATATTLTVNLTFSAALTATVTGVAYYA